MPLVVTAGRRSATVSWWDPQPVSDVTAFLLAAVPEEGSIKNAPQPPLTWQRIPVNGCRQETVTIPNLVSGRSYEFWLQAQSVDEEPVPGTAGTLITRMVGRSSATKIK